MFTVGQKVTALNSLPLKGNDIGPNLEIGKEYEILEIVTDKKGYQHLNVGLPSSLNFVRSFETKEELPRGNKIHWCHPSRFSVK